MRIALGSCSLASAARSSNPCARALGERLAEKLAQLRTVTAAAIARFPEVSTDTEKSDGQSVLFHTHRCAMDADEVLVVLQGFYPSWNRPNYIGTDGVGHLIAEGLVFGPDGIIREAEDDLMWEFR